MNAAFERGLAYCPEIKEGLRSVGSGQAINREFKEAVKEHYLQEMSQTLDALGVPKSQWEKYAAKYASKSVGRIDSGTYAFSRSGGELEFMRAFNGIFVNDVFGKDLKYFKECLAEDLQHGFHPVGCDTVKSVFDHEVAHQIDRAIGLSKNPDMLKLYNSLSDGEISAGLSRYAKKNIGEFIAEGYAEYLNNPQPREIARQIGEIIEKAVKK